MKRMVLLTVLAMAFSVLLLSCDRGREEPQEPRVAVFAFDTAQGVSDDIAQFARNTVVNRVIGRKNMTVISSGLIDERVAEHGAATKSDMIRIGQALGATQIVTSNIAVTGRDDAMDRLAGNIRVLESGSISKLS
ncbi:MAG: hypothetical protein FWB78_11925 [Treponema sp.]|nr:hypothetical protein [Treponema sp.]